MRTELQYDSFEITDSSHIKNFYIAAINAGKDPSAETILETGRSELMRLVPSRKGQSFEDIEHLTLIQATEDHVSTLPATIVVNYSYMKPNEIPLAVPVSRHVSQQWNTARVGTLLEQILDQLRIGNTTSLRTDVLEPISKLAAQGITADAKKLQSLSMELASVKSANAIYEVENGRLMQALADNRDQYETELRKEKAKSNSYKKSTWIPQSENAEETYLALEDADRYTARAILLSARCLYTHACINLLEKPDYTLRFHHFKNMPAYVLNYIHAMADALTYGIKQQKVTLQMAKAAYNKALQADKPLTMAINQKYGLSRELSWNDIHPDIFEPFFLDLQSIVNGVRSA